MPTLVINAPSYQSGKRSFDRTIKSGVGEDYALNSKILPSAQNSTKVIVLDKTKKRKAVGEITALRKTGRSTGNRIPRFDVLMKNLKECTYAPESLNRNGVAII